MTRKAKRLLAAFAIVAPVGLMFAWMAAMPPAFVPATDAEIEAALDPSLRERPPARTEKTAYNEFIKIASEVDEKLVYGAEESFNDANGIWSKLKPASKDLLRQCAAMRNRLGPKLRSAANLPPGVALGWKPGRFKEALKLSTLPTMCWMAATWEYEVGDPSEATRSLEEAAILVNTLAAADVSVTDYLHHDLTEIIFVHSILFLVDSSRTNEDDLERLIRHMKPRTIVAERLARALRGDVIFYDIPQLKDIVRIKNGAKGRLPDNERIPENYWIGNLEAISTARLINDVSQEAVSNCSKPYGMALWTVGTRVEDRVPSRPEEPRTLPGGAPGDLTPLMWFERLVHKVEMRRIPNSAGFAFFESSTDLHKSLIKNSFKYRTEWNAAILRLALEIHKRRFGKVPSSLKELVKLRILPALPLDLYANAGFRYDPKRRIFWSVGTDAVDDGGKTGADLIWKLWSSPTLNRDPHN